MEFVNWPAIESFIGYGRLDALVWFVGMEEGAASDGVEADLVRRSAYATTHELGAFEGSRGDQTPTVRTWRPMSHIMLVRDGQSSTAPTRKKYQNALLGKAKGSTLLVELLPYPHRSTNDWDEIFLSRYPSRSAYQTDMIEHRIELLRSILNDQRPELVVAYGKAHWGSYKKLFPNTSWLTDHPFQVGVSSKTRIVLSPHFASRQLNTEDNLQHLSDLALGRR